METVKIGNQEWSTENLNVDHFNNGDAINQAFSSIEWQKFAESETPAWCFYEFNSENGVTNGKLYNWYAINDIRGLAPKGFNIASLSDWSDLITFLGGTSTAGGKLKSTTGWVSDGRGMGLLDVSDSTNESQFTALPAGLIRQDGSFYGTGSTGTWWTSSLEENNSGKAARLYVEFCYPIIHQSFSNKGMGLSVRCIKV